MKTFALHMLITACLLIPCESNAQDTLRVYLNAGYISSFIQPEDCTRPDAGGSIRIGILTKGIIGFYTGYAWFKEYHEDFIEYDDKGSLLIAGIDLRLLRKKDFRLYCKLGIMNEKFISTYTNRTETESSIKPDIGLLFNYKHFNVYTGWQPSEPVHFNIGVGYTQYFINSNKKRSK